MEGGERSDQTRERRGIRRNVKMRQPESVRRSGQRRRADLRRVVSRGEEAGEGTAWSRAWASCHRAGNNQPGCPLAPCHAKDTPFLPTPYATRTALSRWQLCSEVQKQLTPGLCEHFIQKPPIASLQGAKTYLTIRPKGLPGEERQVHRHKAQPTVRAPTPKVSDNSKRKKGWQG